MIYKHLVQYYETDRMGITHHSNYIRFMEEARGYFMEKTGFSYAQFEELGLSSPVISVQADYKQSTTYGDEISIKVFMLEIERVRVRIGYHMHVGDQLVCKGETGHVFLNSEGRPISLKRSYPEVYQTYLAYQQTQGEF